MIVDSLELYRSTHKSRFSSISVWTILRHAPKWQDILQEARRQKGKNKRPADGPAVIELEPEEESRASSRAISPVDRPIGRKRAKKIVAGGQGESETREAIAGSMEQLVAESKRNNDVLQAVYEEQIMSRSLEGMSENQRRYYLLQQERILQELESRLENR